MNQPEQLLDEIRIKTTTLGAKLHHITETVEYKEIVQVGDRSVLIDQWFYCSFLVHKSDLNPEDNYYIPARSTLCRAVARAIAYRVRAELAEDSDFEGAEGGIVTDSYLAGHVLLVGVTGLPEIGCIVDIEGHRYGVIEGQENQVWLDRPLDAPIKAGTAYRWGLLDALVSCAGATLVLPKVTLIETPHDQHQNEVTINVLAGLLIDKSLCAIDRTRKLVGV